jgi:hypothetical protein
MFLEGLAKMLLKNLQDLSRSYRIFQEHDKMLNLGKSMILKNVPNPREIFIIVVFLYAVIVILLLYVG